MRWLDTVLVYKMMVMAKNTCITKVINNNIFVVIGHRSGP